MVLRSTNTNYNKTYYLDLLRPGDAVKLSSLARDMTESDLKLVMNCLYIPKFSLEVYLPQNLFDTLRGWVSKGKMVPFFS